MELLTKRVAAIHDLSGFGRCSLTVILPVLSAMGIQVCPVPTAVLSTHTGGLGTPVIKDLTDYLDPCLDHYKNLDIGFDAIYSGFLGNGKQVESVLKYFESYPDALKFVDPVMGDNGKAYKTCDEDYQSQMKKLVCEADFITPNLTEAFLLLGENPVCDGLSLENAKTICEKLSNLGPEKVLVHSLKLDTVGLCSIGFDRRKNTFWLFPNNEIPVSYPGCGDVFASVLLGSFLSDSDFPKAVSKATSFTEKCIKATYNYHTNPKYGLLFENRLCTLLTNEKGIYETV